MHARTTDTPHARNGSETTDGETAFIIAATGPLNAWHDSEP